MKPISLLSILLLLSCKNKPAFPSSFAQQSTGEEAALTIQSVKDSSSWAFFLQHLPEVKGPVVDYTGKPVADREKAFAVLPFDVGHRDLQQCADALMRLRAEYLFAQKRSGEIRFHFTGGQAYAYADYLNGKLPVAKGNGVAFVSAAAKTDNHASLRRYLDLVYTYAGTISLAEELETANSFAIGTVVIKPGSPGHCFIITNEAKTAAGETVYKLVEGYTPAQTLYVLRNMQEPALGCWHRLKNDGPLQTASYRFSRYLLKKFPG